MSRRPTQDFFLFLLGAALFAAGLFLFTNQVTVATGGLFGFGGGFGGGPGGRFGSFLGGFFAPGAGAGFGLLMVPFALGVALLLADTLRRLGWFLIVASSSALAVAILQSLIFNFRPASLFSLLAMVFMVGGGAGLMFRSLRGYPEEGSGSAAEEREDEKRELRELRRELEQLRRRVAGEDSGPADR